MASNKLIVKNTVFMAVRMVITMSISLYTSRVVLAQLGFESFGIYNVVGALALLMGFFNSALAYAMQRFMNVELGLTGGKNMQRVFAACCVCTLLISGVFIVIAELLGNWMLSDFLSIPEGRMGDARIVFQLSLLIVVFELLRVPYNSLIIAHEKMAFFAYNSIVEAVLKLAVVIALSLVAGNKLLIYMWLLVGVAVVITGSYVVYSRHNFSNIGFSFRASATDVKSIGKFAGWNLLTCVSDLAFLQGSPMVLNVFFGVTLNATMGVANSVKTAVYAVTRGMQVASNPQIVKSFASGDYDGFTNLVLRISKLSFYIVLFIGLPILLNTEYILSLWLEAIPPQGAIFVRLMIVFCIVDSLTGPLWISMQATGKIALYQIIMSAGWLLSLPIIWFGYDFGFPPYWLLAVWIIIDFVLLWVRLVFNEKYCRIRVSDYFRRVLWPIVKVVAAACVVWVICFISNYGSELQQLLITGSLSCVLMAVAICFLGADREERQVINKLLAKFSHKRD